MRNVRVNGDLVNESLEWIRKEARKVGREEVHIECVRLMNRAIKCYYGCEDSIHNTKTNTFNLFDFARRHDFYNEFLKTVEQS